MDVLVRSTAAVGAASVLIVCGGIGPTSRLPDVSATDAMPYALINGQWFDGDSFVSRTAYVADGTLTFVRPTSVRGTLDLAGGYVIPPLTEAHNHNLGGYSQDTAALRAYLDAGVFTSRS